MIEGNKTIKNNDEDAKFLKRFSQKQSLIPNISNYMFDKTNDSLKEPFRYFENHSRIANIKSKGFDACFSYTDASSNEVKNLNIKKASQKTHIPTKIIELSADFFINYVCKNINYCLGKGELLCVLKYAEVVPVHKEIKSDKVIIDQHAIFLISLKFLKN